MNRSKSAAPDLYRPASRPDLPQLDSGGAKIRGIGCDEMKTYPRHISFSACMCVVALFAPVELRAEILLEGNTGAIRLETTQAPLGEILAALETKYGVRYRASTDLDRPITGKFSGPLARVIAHLLDGYDYVVKVSSGSVEIALLQNRGTEPVRAAAGDAAPRRRTSISRSRP